MAGIGQKKGSRLKPLVRLGNKPEDCWEWTGSISSRTGYGKKQWMGKSISAHRWIWGMLFGTIPEGLVINHICRNRKCVNPTHLEVTTIAGNVRHGLSTKLTAEQAKEIKSASKNREYGVTRKALAKKFGVAPMTVSSVWSGHSWRDV